MTQSRSILAIVCLMIASFYSPGSLFGQPDSAFPAELRTNPPATLDEVRLLEQHVQQLIKKVSPATVSVSGGSGVVISEDGYVLTAAHVNMQAGRRVRLTFPDGTRAWGETQGNDHSHDFGLIKITSEGKWPHVEMGTSADCKPGEWCVAVGFPVSYSRGTDPAARLGCVLRNSNRSIMTDCTIMGGDSGGPLFNLDGQVIGIHSRVNDSLRQNFHVPVDAYKRSWDRLVSAEDWNQKRTRRTRRQSEPKEKPAYLGVHRTDGISEAIISSVTAGSAAEKAGMRAGDVVLEFDGKKVESFDQLVEMVAQRKAGDLTPVLVRRDKQLMQLPLKLGTRK